jgi:hypothetical protein
VAILGMLLRCDDGGDGDTFGELMAGADALFWMTCSLFLRVARRIRMLDTTVCIISRLMWQAS